MNNSSSNSITALVPGGVVTTQNISTVIKPKENNKSMQFVKIQTPELSKKAVEQIRVAQESKITKDKIKEVEEEWQSNLLNWKSKRRQQFVGVHSNDDEQNNNQNDANENGRKIKTFAEMIEERTKTGNRLNFHLERYIGSSESDNYESEHDNIDKTDFVDKEISQLSLNCNNSNNTNHQHRPNNSSHNIISNLSNQNSLTNSGNKNHSIDDNEFFINRNGIQTESTTKDSSNMFIGNGHNDQEDNGATDDEEEDDFDHTRPINSTFKQGVDQPPTPPTIHSDDRIRPSLDVDTRTKEVSSTARFEDNGSDHDDEEDEQEEEQKHLQRIAFVAKLKAFEKMTKPSMQEPRFVAPKSAKAFPPPPPLSSAVSRASHISPQNHSSPPPAPPPIITPPIRNRQPQTKVEKAPQLEVVEKLVPQEFLPPIQQPELTAQQQIPASQPTKQQSQHLDTTQTIPQSLKKQPQEQENRNQAPPIQPARKQPPPPIPISTQVMSSIPSPKQQQQQKQPVSPQTISPIFGPQSPSKLSSTPTLPPSIPPPSPQRHVQKQQSQPVPQRQQSQQHPQPPPPPKDEKSQDRTVLSVSGKKRCSSCKEELGRGAAAFVIESLNLVYHTNCFRCSVCHVNLSNGFRGVDVRVHAGALHCQNCYSKDGLNYSRV